MYIELLKINKNCNVQSQWHLIYMPIEYRIAQNENLKELSVHLVKSNFLKIKQNDLLSLNAW